MQVIDGAKLRRLKLFVIYVNLDLKDGKLIYDPPIKEIIALCKGTDTMIWPNLTSKQFKASESAGDEVAVPRDCASLPITVGPTGCSSPFIPTSACGSIASRMRMRIVKKVDFQPEHWGLTFNLSPTHLWEQALRRPHPCPDRRSPPAPVRRNHQRHQQPSGEDDRRGQPPPPRSTKAATTWGRS